MKANGRERQRGTETSKDFRRSERRFGGRARLPSGQANGSPRNRTPGAAEEDRPSGDPPDSPGSKSKPDAVRRLPECQPECSAELGTGHAPPTTRSAETSGDRKKESARAPERVNRQAKKALTGDLRMSPSLRFFNGGAIAGAYYYFVFGPGESIPKSQT